MAPDSRFRVADHAFMISIDFSACYLSSKIRQRRALA